MSEIEDNLALCISSVQSERVEAYSIVTRKLSIQHHAAPWGTNISSEDVRKVIKNVKEDLFCKENNIAFETTGFLGCFLDNERLMDCLSVQEEQDTFDTLIKLLKTCEDTKILNRALWSFAQSKFGCDIYSKNIRTILNVVKTIMEEEQTSITRYEALQVIKSLLESSPNDMKAKLDVWFIMVFNNFFHESVRVRGIAYSCILICKNMHDCIDVLYTQLIPCLAELKDKHCKTMSSLIDDDCIYILKIWRLIVTILGAHLHPGTALINGLLEVVEKAFKNSRPECRVDAFKCWQVLITNFALDAKVINHPKRMKLLLAPFKSNNAKTEEIAKAKLTAWWHFIVLLGERCSDHFDTVVMPLFKYCFATAGASTSGFERSFVMAAASSPARKYPALHITSIEMLMAVLHNGTKLDSQNYSLSIPELKQKILTPSIFLRNYQLIFAFMGDILQILNMDSTKQFALGIMVLTRVAQHVSDVILADSHKKECVEMVKELLATSTALERANEKTNSFLLEFMKIFVLGKLALPSSIMNSRNYNIPVASKPQELVSGTLNNFFIHKFLKPSLLVHKSNEIYRKMWDELLRKSSPACGKLSFFEFTLEEISNAAPILCSESVETFVGLWLQASSHLHEYIKQENTIDQGDGSDYDWRCMYKYFLFPIKNSHDHLGRIENSPNFQKIVAMLNTMWSTFTSQCSLTATAEPNCECDFIAKEMISLLADKFTGPPDAIAFTLTFMAELLHIIVSQFRFKDLGKKSIKAVQSPARARKKAHVLHNLGGCIDLLCIVMEKAVRIVSSCRGKVMAKIAATATIICRRIPKKYSWYFLSAFCPVLRKAMSINPSAMYTPDVEIVFVEMWTEYALCLERFIGKNLSADQLARLSPILIAGLTSSHDGLKRKTKELWYKNFSSTKIPIPTNLYDILKSVGLPPANISDTLTESQDAFYTSTGIVSSKPTSRINLSPVTPGQKTAKKVFASPNVRKATPKSAKKSIFEMNDDDFVKVSSPSINKRLLTPYQAEKMRNRGSDIPALYSDLSQSMSQLPTGFTTQDSLDQISNENSSRSKELFPPLGRTATQSKKKEDDSLCVESILSPEKKSESPSKCYSDEDLNEILKDTSLELEKSLSETDRSASLLDQKTTVKTTSERKRKLNAPSKKSIDDVRKSLKGTKFSENAAVKELMSKSITSPSKMEDNPTAKRQPLKDVNKSPKKSSTTKGKSNAETIATDSDEEIQCSQTAENSASKSIISKIGIDSPSGQDRPKRNKRKYIDDGYVYATPTKRLKTTTQTSAGCDSATKAISKSKTTEAAIGTVTPSKPKSTKPKLSSDSTESNISDSGCDDKKVTDSVRKRRGGGGGLEVQKLKQNNFDYEPTMLKSPTKMTRSGRRIIAPKKEMPEPITVFSQNTDPIQLSSTPGKAAKTGISPLASRKELKDAAASKAKCVTKLNLAETPSKPAEAASASSNRKLFSSPQPKRVRLEPPPTDSDIIGSVTRSPSKPHSPVRQSLDRATKNLTPLSSPKKQSKRNESPSTSTKKETLVTKRNMPTFPPPKMQVLEEIKNIKSPSPKKQKLETTKSPTPSPSPKKYQEIPKRNLRPSPSPKKHFFDSPKRSEYLSSSPKKQTLDRPMRKEIFPTSKETIASPENSEKTASSRPSDNATQTTTKLDSAETDHQQNTRVNSRKRKSDDMESHSVTVANSPEGSGAASDPPKLDRASIENNATHSPAKSSHNNIAKDKMANNETNLEDEAVQAPRAVVEDENKNMIKDSSEGPKQDDIENSPKCVAPTSFSGLITKGNSPRDRESVGQAKFKTATVIWSPSKRDANCPDNDDNDAPLPFIMVRNFTRKDQSSPVSKGQMLVLRQSPSACGAAGTAAAACSPTEKRQSPSNLRSRQPPTVVAAKVEEIPRRQESPSPLRLASCRLSDTISTPEIHHRRIQTAGQPRSRAAVMLARAQQTMKNKTSENLASPVSRRFSRPNRSSLANGSSPLVGQKSSDLATGFGSPWARFEPSPNASPSSGILKRKRLMEDNAVLTDSDYETSPCLIKNRRVSFADPVFESIEIPPSPKVLRSVKAQKKLDMTKSVQNSCSTTENEAMPLTEVNKEITKDRILDTSKPIYPELTHCQRPVAEIVSDLAAPGMTDSLSNVLQTSSVNTVGDIAQLTESELHMFPVQSPKTERTLMYLKKFAVVESCDQDVNDVNKIITVNGNAQLAETLSEVSNVSHTKGTNDQVAISSATDRLVCDAADEELLQEIHSRLEKSSNLVKKFAKNVPDSKREEMFKSLLPYMPYAKVIDIYSDFLKNKDNSSA